MTHLHSKLSIGFEQALALSSLFKTLLISLVMIAMTACTSLSPDTHNEKTTSTALPYQHNSPLDHYFSALSKKTPGETGFYPLEHGHDALLTRLALIESAQASLDLQYYIFRDDETSQLLSWRLFIAAERGVRVRLLLDDMQKRDDKVMAYINSHPNIEIRLFNPHQYRTARGAAFLSDFDRLNHRMHNKSLTADNVASVIGGRNIGNEYFSFQSDVEFGDFDLLMHGEAVAAVSEQFDEYWNSDFAIPMEWIYPNRTPLTSEAISDWVASSKIEEQFTQGQYDFTQLPLYQKLNNAELSLFWGKAQLIYDSPNKVLGQGEPLKSGLTQFLSQTESELVLISPYFVPTESGTQALISAVEKGIEVTIITNSLASNDVFAVHGWYAKYRQALIEGGVTLWEVKATADIDNSWSIKGSSNASLHAKVIVLDRSKIAVGSMNLDPRSAELNTELAVLFEQPEYAERALAQLYSKLNEKAYQVIMQKGELIWIDHAQSVQFDSEPDASLWLKMGAWISGWLPIESQL